MKYMGSKSRIATSLLRIMLPQMKPGMSFVDMFTGGANVIERVPDHIRRVAVDNNRYLIAMYRALQDGGVFMDEIDKPLYDIARDVYNGRTSGMGDATVGWIGFMASANGRFFDGGYSGRSNTRIGTVRDYVAESIRNIRKQMPRLKGVDFVHSCFSDYVPEQPSLIYCDPPYKGTKAYDTSRNFDHPEFYGWCREMASMGHIVYVSEYSMPGDFTCVWEQEVGSSIGANGVSGGRTKAVEKLFRI